MNRPRVWQVSSRFAQVIVLCVSLLASAFQATAQTGSVRTSASSVKSLCALCLCGEQTFERHLPQRHRGHGGSTENLKLGHHPQTQSGAAQPNDYLFNDSHFHLTNYIQEGADIHDLLKIMGNKTGRVALFGIPLQQQWSYRVDAERGPTYYLNSDAPLYYYSFTDAWIAMAYKSLTKEEQARFDPMITGFNPTDMYAADHIRRVLQTFPGVFSGIGEFTIHKEFVSSKVAGGVASLSDPALDRLIDFAGEVGLAVLIHSDIDTPFPKPGAAPAYLDQMKALLKRHPQTTIIWAHTGMGRIIHPVKDHAATVEQILKDPSFSHVYLDISWDEVAKYFVATPAATKIAADLINRYPDRFLFGTDEVAPANQEKYLKVYNQYGPLWKLLDKETSEKVRKGNYARLFDAARLKVRAWEKAHGHQ